MYTRRLGFQLQTLVAAVEFNKLLPGRRQWGERHEKWTKKTTLTVADVDTVEYHRNWWHERFFGLFWKTNGGSTWVDLESSLDALQPSNGPDMWISLFTSENPFVSCPPIWHCCYVKLKLEIQSGKLYWKQDCFGDKLKDRICSLSNQTRKHNAKITKCKQVSVTI